MSHTTWVTAYDFLGDAFELAWGSEDPGEVFLVLKIEVDGNVLTLSVDGDLFCYITIFKQDDEKIIRKHWQGRSDYKGIPLSDFICNLQNQLKLS